MENFNIFQFFLDFFNVLENMSQNLFTLLFETELLGLPVWAVLGGGTIIITILFGIIKKVFL